jgi:hypothetical protein
MNEHSSKAMSNQPPDYIFSIEEKVGMIDKFIREQNGDPHRFNVEDLGEWITSLQLYCARVNLRLYQNYPSLRDSIKDNLAKDNINYLHLSQIYQKIDDGF